MQTITRRGLLELSAGACTGALALARSAAPARAQLYPSRPIRMVVPFAPGGTTDFVGRVMGEKMSELAGQRFFVENKTGAAGAIGMRDVASSAPDGYTVLMGDTTMAITPTLNPGAGIDPFKMFSPVGLVAVFPSVLVVHPSVPAKTVAELIAHARQHPNKVNFGSGGIGTRRICRANSSGSRPAPPCSTFPIGARRPRCRTWSRGRSRCYSRPGRLRCRSSRAGSCA
jgi:tripartite-type tricarboxylate transporter receptor subunit TctC